jgi:hypothetical protein
MPFLPLRKIINNSTRCIRPWNVLAKLPSLTVSRSRMTKSVLRSLSSHSVDMGSSQLKLIRLDHLA